MTVIVVSVIAMTMPAYAASSKDRTSVNKYIKISDITTPIITEQKFDDDVFRGS